jgi:hypothetical protein
MALSFEDLPENFEVICSKDGAVNCDEEGFSKYLDTLDESLLNLSEGLTPTRFVLKRTLSYEEQRKLKNSQLGFKDGDVQIRLSYMLDEVRYRLVDIKGGGKGVEFKKDSDGYASKALVEKLDSFGIVRELQTAAAAAAASVISKKSSQPSLS